MAYRKKTTRRRKRRSTRGIGNLGANFTTIASAGVGAVLATNLTQVLPAEWSDPATAPLGEYTTPSLQIGAGLATNMLLKGTDAKIREGLAAGMFATGMGTILYTAIAGIKGRKRRVGYGAKYLQPNNVPTPAMVTGKKVGVPHRGKMINPDTRRETITGNKNLIG